MEINYVKRKVWRGKLTIVMVFKWGLLTCACKRTKPYITSLKALEKQQISFMLLGTLSEVSE